MIGNGINRAVWIVKILKKNEKSGKYPAFLLLCVDFIFQFFPDKGT